MSIDWITVIIQALNFLILVWILKKFLYQPILNAMDARQKKVFEKLHKAEERERAAEAEKYSLEEEKSRVKSEEAGIYHEARKEAAEKKSEMIKKAQQEMRDKRVQFESQLEKEKEALYNAVRGLVGKTLVETARDAFNELAAIDIEKKMFSIFLTKIKTLNSDSFASLLYAMKKGHKIIVTASKMPSDSEKAELEKVLEELIGKKPEMKYVENKDMACGVELLVDTILLRWGLDKYIENFGRSLSDALNGMTE